MFHHFRDAACAAACAITALGCTAAVASADPAAPDVTLTGRAVLPAMTFAAGPPSGAQAGIGTPFPSQPVQGFSAVLDGPDGTYWAMPDNGYGTIETSADFHLRVYRIRAALRTATGGAGTIDVQDFIELRDPDHKIPFAIVNAFTDDRILTGADFDIESMRRDPDGSLWFGDEFGPFLIHTDAGGRVLQAPVPLDDADHPGQQLRSPQNPLSEESSALRVMNAVHAQALANGNTKTPVFSPTDELLDDGDATTGVANRAAPPAGSGVAPASSEIFNVKSLQSAGYHVVPYTVDTTARMQALLKLGVNGLISDRSDLLYAAVAAYDADGNGTPGDYLLPDGRIDPAKFDAQGHRGSRDLRPENTLPAMEAGLDNLVTTLETDFGLTKDGVPVLFHDPYVPAEKCRRADGVPYTTADETLIRDITLAQLQSRFICDKTFRGPQQSNDRALSPVTTAFAAAHGLPDDYTPTTVQQLFDFAGFYADYYTTGAGKSDPKAAVRAANARTVRFNIETKINPRTDRDDHGKVYADRTYGVERFADTIGQLITANHLTDRADVQSFDFRTLLREQQRFPSIQTVYLFGDFPVYEDTSVAGTDDGTNLQPQAGETNTRWLGGLPWPYRHTAAENPFRVSSSGGFEGMGQSPDGRTLYPLLEKPLAGDDPKTLLINAFDTRTASYTGTRYRYRLDDRGTNIGDFTMFSATEGVVIERDGSQGDLTGYKAINKVTLGDPEAYVGKQQVVDLLHIADPAGISTAGAEPGDVGLGNPFAFPFQTIEDVLVQSPTQLLVLNDNNLPFSIGRHVGSGKPDDNELITLKLAQPLGPVDGGGTPGGGGPGHGGPGGPHHGGGGHHPKPHPHHPKPHHPKPHHPHHGHR
jgi:glycerophosphoryl diester phosphodiesterase